MKCDVIIPVYNSPEWVKLCVYALMKNTDKKVLGTVYLINDCSDEITTNLLQNLKEKYSEIEVIANEENLGFVKSINKGMKLTKASYVLLLNTDCIVGKNTITKLINHIKKNNRIGLISPIANNAANVSLPMYEGYTYMQMDNLLEKNFHGMCFDACTIVGNCLMITRECIEKTGYLDEIYGMGYGEETDYQFRAMEKGFEAKIAIDTYVFHKAEASFGTSPQKQERIKRNRKIFFDRWGKKYYTLMSEYQKNDPIEYIKQNVKNEIPEFSFIIYLIGFVQNAGGVHNTVDLINYLSINNIACNITYQVMQEYREIMLFNPIKTDTLSKYKIQKIVSTIYLSAFIARKIANDRGIPLIYYSQGYEVLFENGQNYGEAEFTYKIPDYILTISQYLQNKIKSSFGVQSEVINNGVNYDLLHHKNTNEIPKVITFFLRNNYLKGDFVALDIIKGIINKYKNIEINVVYSNKNLTLPLSLNSSITINKIFGNLSRTEITKILQKTDIYIDTSFTEGFGLMALEAMTAGAVPIVSNSGGINEYLKDGVNGYIVSEVNDSLKYLEKIDIIFKDKAKYAKLKQNGQNTSKNYDYDLTVQEYIKYFNKNLKTKKINLSEEEEKIYSNVLDKRFKVASNNKLKAFIYNLCRKVPKRVRIKIKNIVEKVYIFTNER